MKIFPYDVLFGGVLVLGHGYPNAVRRGVKRGGGRARNWPASGNWRTYPLACAGVASRYGQTANEDPRKSEFESKRILNV